MKLSDILSALSWQEWALSSVLFLNAMWMLWWIVSKTAKINTMSFGQSMNEVTRLTARQFMTGHKKKDAVRTVIKLGLLAVFMFGSGMWYRDHQLTNNSHTYFDVLVKDKYSGTKYLLQPARMQPWISNPCTSIDLTVGKTMKFYSYEQMEIPDCHRVKSFEFYADQKGDRLNARN